MSKLKPCPFCEGTDIDPEFWRSGDGRQGPGCNGCSATAETVKLWNTRPGEEAKMREAFEAGLEYSEVWVEEVVRPVLPSMSRSLQTLLAVTKDGMVEMRRRRATFDDWKSSKR